MFNLNDIFYFRDFKVLVDTSKLVECSISKFMFFGCSEKLDFIKKLIYRCNILPFLCCNFLNKFINDACYIFYFSTDSGWDNPFRPDGDLSREADEIVELIKGGKPITPTPGSGSKLVNVEENGIAPSQTATQQSTSPVKGANGSAPLVNDNKKPAQSSPGAVELQRGTVVPPSDASQVEHIVLKKKPKCKCCVIQ